MIDSIPPKSSRNETQRSGSSAIGSLGDSGAMEIPFSDKRIYEHVTLSNGLSCLLISDDETEKAAASVAVAVGQMQGGDIFVSGKLYHLRSPVS